MILTTKGRYAVVSMLYIAKYGEDRSISLAEISNLQNISLNYLEQIFAKLKKAGLVVSVRGPGGGYKLAKSADETYTYSVTKAVEEEIVITKCGNNSEHTCLPKSVKCLAHDLWSKLENDITDYLQNVTLADVLNASKKEAKPNIYFDYNATSRISKKCEKAMADFGSIYLNPSSIHKDGRHAKSIMEKSREKIANSLGMKLGVGEYSICFTASGTEANNLLVHNFRDKQIAISSIEHPSIQEPANLNMNKIIIPVNTEGLVDRVDLESILKEMDKGSLVSIMYANNETGVIQNIKNITDLAHKYGIFVHSDLIQALGKIPFNLEELGLDFATISSHKIGGPVGAAALIHRTNFHIIPQIIGGGQEKGKRAGTENVVAIFGFAEAVEIATNNIDDYSKVSEIRDWIESQIKYISPNSIIYSGNAERLPNTLMIQMPNVDAQTQLIFFDVNGVSISTGSACSSGKVKSSHVLQSMGYDEKESKETIRISLGPSSNLEEAKTFISLWENLFNKKNMKVA